jgi:beta-phosphoglucomutase-like phosphatase (HAD superfamily)
MTLKAVLFDFHNTIINDAALQQSLLDELLITENLRPDPYDYLELCWGHPDRTCIKGLLERRGRVVEAVYLNKLIQQRATAYCQQVQQIDPLPIYMDIPDFLFKLRTENIRIAVVTSALRSVVELVLEQSQLVKYIDVIISGDEVSQDPPDPARYHQAIASLNAAIPDLDLHRQHCLAVESSYVGIEAAQRAGISVVAVANTRPLHMLQRRADWVVDSISELELQRVQNVLAQQASQVPSGS